MINMYIDADYSRDSHLRFIKRERERERERERD